MDLSGDEVDHHHHHHHHDQHHQMAIPIIQETNPPHLLPLYSNNNTNSNSNSSSMKKMMTVKYKECLKNHAASIGGNATDGCGEFMPSGEEGSLEALKCSACNCHRNFHRKEIEGMHEHSSSCTDHLQCYHHHQHHHQQHYNNSKQRKGLLISQHQMIMPLGVIHSSDQSDHEMAMARPAMAMKKRFRTKFSPQQKEKMLDFANQVGWKLQKQEETFVQQFCQEIGVKRRVLKVWMHNNKHNLAKKINTTCDDPPSSSSPPPPPPLLHPPPLLE